MKIGISIPNNWGVEDPSRLIDLAVRAESAGFASVWTSEHLINVSYVRDRIGDRPYHHPLTILSGIAARTQRISLGTSVLILPFHNPFGLAKYVATLDQLSHGRVILGAGVGNVQEEFLALGVPWTQRGTLTNEAIEVLRALWAPGAAAHEGKACTFSDVQTAPKPFKGRRLPIWIGGMSDAALRRVIRHGDGWHPTALSPADLKCQIRRLSDMAREQGCDPLRLDICMRFNVSLDDQPVTEAELLSTMAKYDTGHALRIARNYQAAGVTHFVFALNGHDPEVLENTVDNLARDILPVYGHTP